MPTASPPSLPSMGSCLDSLLSSLNNFPNQVWNFSAIFAHTWMRQVQLKAVSGRWSFQVWNFSAVFAHTWKML